MKKKRKEKHWEVHGLYCPQTGEIEITKKLLTLILLRQNEQNKTNYKQRKGI